MEAALEDQELFDELAREQALRDLLSEPAAKARLLAALDEPPKGWWRRWTAFRPAAVMAAVAAVSVVAVVVEYQARLRMRAPELARVISPLGPSAATPPAAPVPPANQPAGKPVETRQAAPARRPAFVAPSPAEPASGKSELAKLRAEEKETDARGAAADTVGAAPATAAAPAAAPAPPPPAQAAPPAASTGQNVRDLFYSGAAANQFAAGSGQPAALEPRAAAGAAPQTSRQPGPARGTLGALSGFSARRATSPRADATPNAGVKYTLLKRMASGEFRETSPADLRAGDTVELRFEVNDNGLLTAIARGDSGTRVVVARQMQRLAPFTTDPLRPDERRVEVTFSREPAGAPGKGVGGMEVKRTALSEQATAERTTYVVGPAARQVSFTINLEYR